jgi:hypothetical protein
MWKEGFMTSFDVRPMHLLGGNEIYHKTLTDLRAKSRSRGVKNRGRSANHLTTMIYGISIVSVQC